MTFCWEPNNLPYLTQVLDLPPLVAQAAFDAARSARACQNRPAVWDIATPAGRLELHGDGRIAAPPRPCYWSYRDVPGPDPVPRVATSHPRRARTCAVVGHPYGARPAR